VTFRRDAASASMRPSWPPPSTPTVVVFIVEIFCLRHTMGSTSQAARQELEYMHPAGGRLDRSFDELDDAGCRGLMSHPLGQLEKCSSCDLPLHSAENANELHELNLAGNELSSFGASGITDLVGSCRSLVTLELQGNNIGPGDD